MRFAISCTLSTALMCWVMPIAQQAMTRSLFA
jgi:hypothetical protein